MKNQNWKWMMAMAGAGILGMLTGCGTDTPMEMTATMQSMPQETVEQPEGNDKATVSGNHILDQLNQPFGEQPLDENGNPIGNSSTNNASSGGILPGEDKQSEPVPSGVSKLIALADSEEEAQRIAELYQIELESFDSGVAFYTTDKDVAELIKMGTENDYPPLSINNKQFLY